MTTKRSDAPSPVGAARAQQQRMAAEERTRVMAEAEQNAVSVRKNMDRLRTLRLAKEAEDALAAARGRSPQEAKQESSCEVTECSTR